MSVKRVVYVLLILAVGFSSALIGSAVGGVVVYRTMQSGQANNLSLPVPIVSQTKNTSPNQTLQINTTNIETTITQAAQKVGPAVVTVVGTIPGQATFFGQTGDQTVSGSGVFITDSGYVLPIIMSWMERRMSPSSFQMEP